MQLLLLRISHNTSAHHLGLHSYAAHTTALCSLLKVDIANKLYIYKPAAYTILQR